MYTAPLSATSCLRLTYSLSQALTIVITYAWHVYYSQRYWIRKHRWLFVSFIQETTNWTPTLTTSRLNIGVYTATPAMRKQHKWSECSGLRRPYAHVFYFNLPFLYLIFYLKLKSFGFDIFFFSIFSYFRTRCF